MRLTKLALPALISFCAVSTKAFSAQANLLIVERFQAPMRELSALAQREGELLFASDREHDLLRALFEGPALSQSALDLEAKIPLDLDIPSSEQAQWEAMLVSGKEGLFLLKETGSEIFHFSPEGASLGSFELQAWNGRKNPKRGFEGILPLRNGHFLIALEAEPPALIEYGPEGDESVGFQKGDIKLSESFVPPATKRLIPLKAWTTDTSVGDCEYSELAEDPEGGFYILMKSCLKIVKVDELKANKSTFKATTIYSVPNEIDHPEGLSVGQEGDFWLGIDRKDKGTNLYRLSR